MRMAAIPRAPHPSSINSAKQATRRQPAIVWRVKGVTGRFYARGRGVWVGIITRISAVGCAGGAAADSARLVAVELGLVEFHPAVTNESVEQNRPGPSAFPGRFCAEFSS
jgi:hypothetical protein